MRECNEGERSGHSLTLCPFRATLVRADPDRGDILAFAGFPREVWRQILVQQPAGTAKTEGNETGVNGDAKLTIEAIPA
jgi:hypothetical protein